MSALFEGGMYPPVLTMMENGMSYLEYKELKRSDPEELYSLYYFVIARTKAEKAKLDSLARDRVGQGQVVKYKWVNPADYEEEE